MALLFFSLLTLGIRLKKEQKVFNVTKCLCL